MPAPLDVDREAVKAHAITHGVRQAARHFGLPEDTVCQWSKRYGWLENAGVAIIAQPKPASIAPKPVSGVSKPADAARLAMQELSAKSKLGLAKAVLNGAEHASTLEGKDVIDRAQQIKSLVDAGDKLYQWSGQPGTPTLRLELIAGAVGSQAAEELPAIDVEAEVVP